MTKYLAWDIEISKVLPDEETDWQAHMPLGISCMATYAQGEQPRVWVGSGGPPPPSAMSRDDLRRFIDYLRGMVDEGYTILTWNGLSFDWHQLAYESGMHRECCELATAHVDVMFQVHCVKGFPLGLDAVCRGMRLPGKPEGMDGAKAPVLWQAGEYDTVLRYVAQDVRCTLQVALEIEQRRGLQWIARSGRLNSLPIQKLMTVAECLREPLPDTSWMSDPLPRSKFTAWMDRNAAS